MTAPRPEAVELARYAMAVSDTRLVGEHEEDQEVQDDIAQRLDAALTAARADERERAAKVCEERAARYFGQGRGIALKLAAAIREGFDAHS